MWDLQIVSSFISLGVFLDMFSLATQNFPSQSCFLSLFHIGDNVISNLMYEHGTVMNFIHTFALYVQSLPLSSIVRERPKDLVVFSKDSVAVAQSLPRLLEIPCCE